MSSVNSTVPTLREMISIEEQREDLVRQIRTIDARLIALRATLNFDRLSLPSKPDVSGIKSSSRAGHGSLKREILALLQKAGSEGISVKEISSFLNIKAANIYAWFHSTGRNVPQISKIGEARYALNGELPPEPEPKPRRDPSTAGSNQPRGGLTKKIFATLERFGEPGITVKQLADEVESNYRNVAVWFATTGKKFSTIKKLGPAHYRLEAPSEVSAEQPAPEQVHHEQPPHEHHHHDHGVHA